jgi:Skp family chaperone for outer membrane proteins
MHRLLTAAAVIAALSCSTWPSVPTMAQDYFIPGQRPAARPTPRVAPHQGPVARPMPAPSAEPGTEAEQPLPQVPLPPVPELPALDKGPAPPTPVIGVIGVPEVMHGASSAQQVEKVIGDRRDKLNQDAQKEQAAWRDLQQSLANERSKLSPEQVRNREKELQDRITTAQRTFRDRNRIIQEAAQVALGQIERTLIGVIRQVAESRGMNLVLHRAQVALNVNEFDITDQVVSQMNKILPSVTIPADGVSPLAQQQQKPETQPASAPTGNASPAPSSTPAPK